MKAEIKLSFVIILMTTTISEAQVPPGVNPNEYLRKQLEENPMQRTEVPFQKCVDFVNDQIKKTKDIVQIDSNTKEEFTVRIINNKNKVNRYTCYQDQLFRDSWTQRR